MAIIDPPGVEPSFQKGSPRRKLPGRLRGKRFVGIVASDKMDKTRRVEVARSFRDPRYGKILHRTTVCHMHDEHNTTRVGDRVVLAECRPLSRLKRWILVGIVKKADLLSQFGGSATSEVEVTELTMSDQDSARVWEWHRSGTSELEARVCVWPQHKLLSVEWRPALSIENTIDSALKTAQQQALPEDSDVVVRFRKPGLDASTLISRLQPYFNDDALTLTHYDNQPCVHLRVALVSAENLIVHGFDNVVRSEAIQLFDGVSVESARGDIHFDRESTADPNVGKRPTNLLKCQCQTVASPVGCRFLIEILQALPAPTTPGIREAICDKLTSGEICR